MITFSVVPVLGAPTVLANPSGITSAFVRMAQNGGTTAFFGEVAAIASTLAGDEIEDIKPALTFFLSSAGRPEISDFTSVARRAAQSLGELEKGKLRSLFSRLAAGTGPGVEIKGVEVTGVAKSSQVRGAKIGGIEIVTDVGSGERSNAKLRELDLRYEMLLGNVLSIKYSERASAMVDGNPVTDPGKVSFSFRGKDPKKITLKETEEGFDLVVNYSPKNSVTVSFDMRNYFKYRVSAGRKSGVGRART